MSRHVRKVLVYLLLGAASNYVFAVGGALLPQWQSDIGRWVQSVVDRMRGHSTWIRHGSGPKDVYRPIEFKEVSASWTTYQEVTNYYAFDVNRDIKRLTVAEQFAAIDAEIDRVGSCDLAAAFAHVRQGPNPWVFAVSRSKFGWPCRALYLDYWLTVSSDASEDPAHQRYSANIGPFFGLKNAEVPCMPILAGFTANSAFWGGTLALTVFAMRRSRRAIRRWRNPTACTECGYDMQGLSTAQCPECGDAAAVAHA